MKKSFLLFLILITWGCTTPEENNIPDQFKELKNLTVFASVEVSSQALSFKKEGVFGDSEEVLIGRMGAITADSLGRVFIADLQEMVIKVYESNGSFITRLGREGRGPGEFGYIKSLQIRNNRLYGFDSKQNKVNIFGLDSLNIKETLVLARNRTKYPELKGVLPQIDELFVTSDAAYIAKFKSDDSNRAKEWQNFDFTGLMYPMDKKGKISTSKLLSFKMATGTQVGTLFSDALIAYHLEAIFGNTLIVLSSDNKMYFADPNHFLIKVYNSKGVYQHAFYYPLEGIPLTKELAIEAKLPPLYVNNWETIDRPNNWPVIIDMKMDDQNRLWVATTVEDMSVYEWWVLESSGELLTKFNWSRDKPIQQIRNEYLYTKEKNEEGSDIVIKYKIEFKEREQPKELVK